MVAKTYPYIAMINQRYHRTYIDCQEFGVKTPCCPDCLSGKHSMLDAPVEKRIYVKPPTTDGHNVEWSMNIEGVVCCEHHHETFIGREGWLLLVEKYQATPFYNGQRDTRYELDDDGVSLVSAASSHTATKAARPRVVATAKREKLEEDMQRCVICLTRIPKFKRCHVCFPTT